MSCHGLFRSDRIDLDVDPTLGAVLDRTASLAADTTNQIEQIRSALAENAGGDRAVLLGNGAAVPHASIEGLDQERICLVRTREPISIDGSDVDLFFAVIAPSGDALRHLALLAHLSRLVRSQVLIEGLRRAVDAEEALLLIEAAEARFDVVRAIDQEAQKELALIEVAGEAAVDRLLVDLAEAGFGDTILLETQSLTEVLTSELPLFARFHDLFGDPGGSRLFLVSCTKGDRGLLDELVRDSCQAQDTRSARVWTLPMSHSWSWAPKMDEPGGH